MHVYNIKKEDIVVITLLYTTWVILFILSVMTKFVSLISFFSSGQLQGESQQSTDPNVDVREGCSAKSWTLLRFR